jgi:hypothetical protein
MIIEINFCDVFFDSESQYEIGFILSSIVLAVVLANPWQT